MATPTQESLRNQTIFITGVTGLVGKELLRKILATCGVKKVYVLLREKKQWSIQDRLERLLDSFVIQSLKKPKSELREKVIPLKGDCSLPNLGLDENDRNLLEKEVNFVVHSSASVRFDEKLRAAVDNNIRSVRDIVRLCTNIKNLKAAVYVSTAYSNCNQKSEIEEKIYNSPMIADELIALIEKYDDTTLDEITPQIIDPWPNTYTFTKAIAEDLLKSEARRLPFAIVRPAIVASSVNEPVPGYVDKIQGFSGMGLATYTGLLRSQVVKGNLPLNLVPTDYLSNLIIMVLAFIAANSNQEIHVYNYAGSKKNILTWDHFLRTMLPKMNEHPTSYAIWRPFLFISTNKPLVMIVKFFIETIPHYILHYCQQLAGKKSQILEYYGKLREAEDLLIFFSLNAWVWQQSNSEKLWEMATLEDRQLFPFNMDNLDWDKHIAAALDATRLYVLKESIDTLPAARRKRNIFAFIHNSIQILGCLLLLACIYYIVKWISTF